MSTGKLRNRCCLLDGRVQSHNLIIANYIYCYEYKHVFLYCVYLTQYDVTLSRQYTNDIHISTSLVTFHIQNV